MTIFHTSIEQTITPQVERLLKENGRLTREIEDARKELQRLIERLMAACNHEANEVERLKPVAGAAVAYVRAWMATKGEKGPMLDEWHTLFNAVLASLREPTSESLTMANSSQMTDPLSPLVREVARTWVEGGGNALDWPRYWYRVLNEIARLEGEMAPPPQTGDAAEQDTKS
jgi:hypothetical protein